MFCSEAFCDSSPAGSQRSAGGELAGHTGIQVVALPVAGYRTLSRLFYGSSHCLLICEMGVLLPTCGHANGSGIRGIFFKHKNLLID